MLFEYMVGQFKKLDLRWCPFEKILKFCSKDFKFQFSKVDRAICFPWNEFAVRFIISFTGGECVTTSGPQPGKPCHFPFVYNGNTYFECTESNHDQLWCSTEVDVNGSYFDKNWGNCGEGCKLGNLQTFKNDR